MPRNLGGNLFGSEFQCMPQDRASGSETADRITELLWPEAFDHPARDLRLIETQISWVILAGAYVCNRRSFRMPST